jgi:hypothetical protein
MQLGAAPAGNGPTAQQLIAAYGPPAQEVDLPHVGLTGFNYNAVADGAMCCCCGPSEAEQVQWAYVVREVPQSMLGPHKFFKPITPALAVYVTSPNDKPAIGTAVAYYSGVYTVGGRECLMLAVKKVVPFADAQGPIIDLYRDKFLAVPWPWCMPDPPYEPDGVTPRSVWLTYTVISIDATQAPISVVMWDARGGEFAIPLEQLKTTNVPAMIEARRRVQADFPLQAGNLFDRTTVPPPPTQLQAPVPALRPPQPAVLQASLPGRPQKATTTAAEIAAEPLLL